MEIHLPQKTFSPGSVVSGHVSNSSSSEKEVLISLVGFERTTFTEANTMTEDSQYSARHCIIKAMAKVVKVEEEEPF
jgi:hypothetical protein